MTAVWVSLAATFVLVAGIVVLLLVMTRRERPVPHVVQVARRYGDRQVVALFPARSWGAALARYGTESRRWDWRRYEVTLHRAGGRR